MSETTSENTPEITFNDLNLSDDLLKALAKVGYETPSPIQAETIPIILEGRDIVGQAQTGTGKTAAFALPLLSKLDMSQKEPQILVLAPTRELAIQVAEAFQKYANFIKGFHVLPIYGGQDYTGQIRGLKRGAHVVVGTPGRVMDHMRKGTLLLDKLQALVLDEADEMLRMGFIDDVEWILDQTPEERQVALFSATMPKEIRRIAQKYLKNPKEITIKVKTATANLIRQRYWLVRGTHKLDALTRILEVEEFEGMIIFVRTKTATVELAEKLEARGFSAAALNGDLSQKQREKTVEQLKNGKLDIVIATDVAARGLDVERISHVINFDIPYDTESYIHRIGRTGRAGREGDAILFVAPREQRMLSSIEKATGKPIERMDLPTTDTINEIRTNRFKQKITDTLANEDVAFFEELLQKYCSENDAEPIKVAAALGYIMQDNEPFFMDDKPEPMFGNRDRGGDRGGRNDRGSRGDRGGRGDRDRGGRSKDAPAPPEAGMKRYRVGVGYTDKVKPGNIVGAIANEAGIPSNAIGRIEIFDRYALVDLTSDIPAKTIDHLKEVWCGGRQLQMREWEVRDSGGSRGGDGGGKKRYGKSGGGESGSRSGGGRSRPGSFGGKKSFKKSKKD